MYTEIFLQLNLSAGIYVVWVSITDYMNRCTSVYLDQTRPLGRSMLSHNCLCSQVIPHLRKITAELA